MTPRELTIDEALALICLVRQMVVADGVVSVAELAQMHEIGGKLGADMYARAADLAEHEPPTVENSVARAATITRKEAQECVWQMLTDLASADGLDDTEQDLLNLVQEVWSH